MLFIDPHTHMISRTTDDYEAMAAADAWSITAVGTICPPDEIAT